MTQLLLQAPAGSFCSMEHLDDVAQEHTDTGVRLIQSKSALTANPVADRAKSLWKTLSNWATLATDAGCDLKRVAFEIYVSRPVGGQIVEAFAKARTQEQARAAIAHARDMLWGPPPDFALKGTVADDIAPYLECVFNAHARCLELIICNFQLTVGTGSPQADIEAIIRTHPVSPARVGDIADHMCGVVKRMVDQLLEEGKPAVIARDAFHEAYASYVRRIDRDTVLLSRARRPSEEESRGQLPKVFVQQLDLIGMDFEDKLEAVGDYLMAAADRTIWALSGEVDPSSFDELDAVLKRGWKNKKRACTVAHGSKVDEQQGQALYADCMDISVPVQAMQPPGHFIPGCLHRLADDLLIGWHPDYERQIKLWKAA
ncbi:ABC-three component system protein [Burkholderia cepacia]|uniref:ABC-three component system protein n=1 Tax=Burkholderia cepacia TaxID=292 RepID=UPI001E650375|nr:ABC-three component system protein [Burkholderia cepacia]